jgi:alanyl-tRNA synthetase
VDTGMGFERITAVLQNKPSNYDTDVFTPIFTAIQKVTGAPRYTGKLDDLRDIAYRVIADHIRALTIAVSDGAHFGNEGREYVLRRILRRAERYGRQHMMMGEPFLCQLVPAVVTSLGGTFPELNQNPQRVADLIRDEEKSFIRTLDRGIARFMEVSAKQAIENRSKTIAGHEAFVLHDTYGLYIDIVEQMAQEYGLKVDRKGFDDFMEASRRRTREAQKKHVISAVSGNLPNTNDSLKYGSLDAAGKILGWVKDNTVVGSGRLEKDEEAALLLDQTNFYAEQGGQVGDMGIIETHTGRFTVQDTQKLGNSVLHVGVVRAGLLESNQPATLTVLDKRLDTMRNHTATHLLNWALRKTLGEHIEQKGSLVDADKTRFDFTHQFPLTHEEIGEVERLVNERIYADLPVNPVVMPLAAAKKIPGVRAVFGEKYPDPVRVLLIGAERPEEATAEHSVEFCGGTHLNHTGQAGFFKIISQEAVGKGVRRVTAVTGREAVAAVQRLSSVVDSLVSRFNCKLEDVPARFDALQDEIKKLQQQLKKGAAGDLQSAADKLLAGAADVNGAKIIVGEMPPAPEEQMRQQIDRLRQKTGSTVIVLGWSDDGKVQLIAAVSDDLVKKGVKAGTLVGEAAKVVGGKGGGRPTMAQAGGKEPGKLGEALRLARKLASEQLAR